MDTAIWDGKCFPAHDLFVTESQGAIHEQADEHLASSDVAIARARRLLAEAIRTMEAGGDPRGVVRDPVENVFDDIVVITKQLPAGTDITALLQQTCLGAHVRVKPDRFSLAPAASHLRSSRSR